jgi:hypothetical protein
MLLIIGSQRQADAGCQIGWDRNVEPGPDSGAEHVFEPERSNARRARIKVGLDRRVMLMIQLTVEEGIQLLDGFPAVSANTRKGVGRERRIRRRAKPWLNTEHRLGPER